MGENFEPNERLYIEVLSDNSYTGCFAPTDLKKTEGIDDPMDIKETKLLIKEDDDQEI